MRPGDRPVSPGMELRTKMFWENFLYRLSDGRRGSECTPEDLKRMERWFIWEGLDRVEKDALAGAMRDHLDSIADVATNAMDEALTRADVFTKRHRENYAAIVERANG